MSTYPAWLIRRVAAAAARGVDQTADLYGDNPHAPDGPRPWSQDYIDQWEQGAHEVLDTLGFYPTYPDSPLWKAYTNDE